MSDDKGLSKREQQAAVINMIQNDTLFRQDMITRMLSPGKDINYECGYPTTVSNQDYKDMYDRESISKRVVNLLPEETWSQPPEVFERQEAEKTEFEKTWDALVRDYSLYHYLERIDTLSGICHYGLLVFGLGGAGKMETPVPTVDPTTGMRKEGSTEKYELLYMKPYDETSITISERESNKNSPRYGYPTVYTIQVESPTGASSGNVKNTTEQKVHWTRVLHIADNRDSSEIYGIPRMQPVYNRLLDLRKILAGSGEMFWKGGFPGYSFEVNPEQGGVDLDEETLRETFEAYSQGLQRYLAIQGVTAKSLAPQVADPRGHINVQLQAIFMCVGAPLRIALGTEEGKLASTQDKRLWSERITRRRRGYATPMIVRPLVDRFIAYGILPEVEEYYVTWPDRGAANDKDIADVARIRTQALKDYVQGDVHTLIDPTDYLVNILRMSVEEASAITKKAEEYSDDVEREEEAKMEREADKAVERDIKRSKATKPLVPSKGSEVK